jgi:hypothetical protein
MTTGPTAPRIAVVRQLAYRELIDAAAAKEDA